MTHLPAETATYRIFLNTVSGNITNRETERTNISPEMAERLSEKPSRQAEITGILNKIAARHVNNADRIA